jgi:hypothetical protein
MECVILFRPGIDARPDFIRSESSEGLDMEVFENFDAAVAFMESHWMYKQGAPFQIVALDEL